MFCTNIYGDSIERGMITTKNIKSIVFNMNNYKWICNKFMLWIRSVSLKESWIALTPQKKVRSLKNGFLATALLYIKIVKVVNKSITLEI